MDPFSSTVRSSLGQSFAVSQAPSRVWLFATQGLRHTRLPRPSLSPGVYSNSCSSSRWCHPTVSSSVAPFFCCLQSFPASGSFPKSQLFTSGGQVLEFQHQSFQWILRVDFLLSKGLSRVFSYITIQKHQFFGAQPSLWFNSHICTWLLEKP